MQHLDSPAITLDGRLLRENLLAWRRHSSTAIRAVVKADGYCFGLANVVRELHGTADGFVVSDARDLAVLRAISDAPAATLAELGPLHASQVADLGGIVNVARLDSLSALLERSDAASLSLRVGLRLAAGWSAIDEADAHEFAERIASAGAGVELWTHLSSPSSDADDRERFERFVTVFRGAGAHITSVDVESTYPAARGRDHMAHVRIGAGLFGAAMQDVSGVRCAIAVHAPVVDRIVSNGTLRAGYGDAPWDAGTPLTVVRCGYSDGFPRFTKPYGAIVSVGMQYSVVRGAVDGSVYELLSSRDDLDALASASNVLTHQIITGLGRAREARPRDADVRSSPAVPA